MEFLARDIAAAWLCNAFSAYASSGWPSVPYPWKIFFGSRQEGNVARIIGRHGRLASGGESGVWCLDCMAIHAAKVVSAEPMQKTFRSKKKGFFPDLLR